MTTYIIKSETTIEEKNGVHLKRFEIEVPQKNGSWKREAFYEVGVECDWSEPFTRKQSAMKYFKECIAE